jgi:hypothetical protein
VLRRVRFFSIAGFKLVPSPFAAEALLRHPYQQEPHCFEFDAPNQASALGVHVREPRISGDHVAHRERGER